MVTVAIRALELEYLDKILDSGRSRSRYIFTDSDSTALAVSRRPFSSEARVLSQVSPCEFCDGQSGTWTGFAPSTSVLPCQCHSILVTYSSLSTCCSYQKDKRAKPGNLKKAVLFRQWGSTG
jgi:hypothetical protein